MGLAFQRYLYRNYRLVSSLNYWIRRRLTWAGWLVFAGLVVMAARVDTNLSVGYQAFSLLFFLFLTAFITSTFSRLKFTVKRSLPRIGSVQVPLPYRLTVYNQTHRALRGLTLWENLADPRPTFDEFIHTPEPGEARRNWYDRTYGYYRWRWLVKRNQRGQVQEQPLALLPAQGKLEVDMELIPLQRGYCRFETVGLAAPDPFGLCRAVVQRSAPQSILILPKRYALPAVALPGTLKYQIGGVALASSVGESEEFTALRDYRAGDPLRHIHWKSWAKVGKPIVKEFQDEFFVRHALILDTFGDSEVSDLFEEAVSIAASFACTLQTQDSLLDLLFIGPQAFCFTVGRGVAHLEQMLEVLASVQLCRNKTFAILHNLVVEHSAAVSGCVCIFLGWDEPRQQLVAHLQSLGIPMLVLIVVEDAQKMTVDPGPLREHPECFHVLEKSRIAEGLARL